MNFRLLLLLALLALRPPAIAAEDTLTTTNAPVTNNLAAATNGTPLTPETNTPPASTTNAAPTQLFNTDLAEAFRGMQLRKGYRLQLVAAEPLIHSPVALAFDANGRLFVAEQPTDPVLGRIKVLEDTDGDGMYDKARVFADNVPHPTALTCYSSGVFVASGSQILFLADTTGTGVADVRREVFGGFDTGNTNLNYGAGISHFTWGLDNRIHAASGGVGGNIACRAIPTSQTLALDGYDFAFDPRSLAMSVEAGGTSRGVSFDNNGRRFTCAAAQAAQFAICDPIRATRNPLFIWPQLTQNIAREGNNPSARISSLLVYRGGVLGTNAVDDLFFADTAAGVVSRRHIRDNALLPTLDHLPGETRSEFLSSTNPSFRPIQIVSGPDSSLYVADLAREQLDSVSEDGGRIWRISPAGMKPQAPPQMTARKTPELVGLLSSPNGWVRDTAARLLFERRDTNAVPLLVQQLTRSKEPLARLHALRALSGLEALTETHLLIAFQDGDDRVREHAVLLTETFIRGGDVSNALWNQLTALPKDRSLRVRFQAALTLGALPRRNVAPTLADLLLAAPGNEEMQFATLTAARSCADEVFIDLVGDIHVRTANLGVEFLDLLAWQAGAQKSTGMDQVLTAIERAQMPRASDGLKLARNVGEGLASASRTFRTAAPQGTWRGFGSGALDFAMNGKSVEVRAEAIRFLGVSGFNTVEVVDWLLAFLVANEPQPIQSAAIDALSRYQAPAITAAFLQRWPSLSETSQREIITRMLLRFDRTMALVTALEQKRIPLTALSDVQVNFLRAHRDPNTAARAVRLFGPAGQTGLAARFSQVLGLKGDVRRGRQVFESRCASCHTLGGEGVAFGPDLSHIANDRQKLLQDILEPDREIRPNYRTSVIQRTDSQLLFGLTSNAGADVVVLRQPGATQFIPRTQIDDTYPQNWSLMPEDAAAGLTAAQLADLIEFITLPR